MVRVISMRDAYLDYPSPIEAADGWVYDEAPSNQKRAKKSNGTRRKSKRVSQTSGTLEPPVVPAHRIAGGIMLNLNHGGK